MWMINILYYIVMFCIWALFIKQYYTYQNILSTHSLIGWGEQDIGIKYNPNHLEILLKEFTPDRVGYEKY